MSPMTIEMYVALPLPPLAVRDAAMRVLNRIGKHEEHYRDLRLSVTLPIPGHAQVSVPIEASVSGRPQRWEAGLRIEASSNRGLFPSFDGTLSVTPDGGNEAELWLQGSYAPPAGALGERLDATLMHGAAQQSLRQFLTWLGGEVKAEVERSERERLDQARRYHG